MSHVGEKVQQLKSTNVFLSDGRRTELAAQLDMAKRYWVE